MSEVVSPSPKSRLRLLIILAAVLILVIALVVGSFFLASSRASSQVSDYKHDFTAWAAKDESALLGATAALPAYTYSLRGDPGSKANLARATKACRQVATSIKQVKDQSDRLPTMPGSGLLAKISSDYKAAGEKSDHRVKDIKAYAKQASGILAQLERDCSWNIAWNRAEVKSSALYKKSEKYLMKQGQTEPGATCPDKGGCVSSITSKKNTYADLRVKAEKLEKQHVLSLLTSKRCAETSYGAACRTLAKNYAAVLKAGLAYDTFIRATGNTVENAGMKSRYAAIGKAQKSATSSNRKAVLALDRTLKDDIDVKKTPLWTDNFFDVMDKHLLAKLDSQRLALEGL